MTTPVTMKKTCAKCDKGAGTAMCYGCKQAFCTRHFIEHRQELSQQMDNIGQEHDVLQRDMTNEQHMHPLLAYINQWEQKSITKIQTAAESARTNLQQLLQIAKNNLKTPVSKMTEELQLRRESDDYTELDIKKWTDQLQEFRKMLDNPTTINIDYEHDTRSAIRLIKVNDQQSSSSFCQASKLRELDNRISLDLKIPSGERVVDVFGKAVLSEQGLIATCLGDRSGWASISGLGRYSSGVHHIRFRIEQRNTLFYQFFGIVSSSEKSIKDIQTSTSRHGWWDLDYNIAGGKKQRDNLTATIQRGDEVTLMLDCDNRQIQLEHYRTNRIAHMPVDLGLCAFPWKTIVLLGAKNDRVRILH
jgi:hypothetical protein